jgi:hypothetical protein
MIDSGLESSSPLSRPRSSPVPPSTPSPTKIISQKITTRPSSPAPHMTSQSRDQFTPLSGLDNSPPYHDHAQLPKSSDMNYKGKMTLRKSLSLDTGEGDFQSSGGGEDQLSGCSPYRETIEDRYLRLMQTRQQMGKDVGASPPIRTHQKSQSETKVQMGPSPSDGLYSDTPPVESSPVVLRSSLVANYTKIGSPPVNGQGRKKWDPEFTYASQS